MCKAARLALPELDCAILSCKLAKPRQIEYGSSNENRTRTLAQIAISHHCGRCSSVLLFGGASAFFCEPTDAERQIRQVARR